jgi:hypothetical protein
LFFIWLANSLHVHFVPPGNILGICNLIEKMFKKCLSPSEHFCMIKMFKHISEHFFAFCWVYSIPTYVRQLPPPPLPDKSIPQHGLFPLFISGIPITSQSLTVSSNCRRLAKSPSMINHTTAGNKQQKWVATTERAEHATTYHWWEWQRLVAAGNKIKRATSGNWWWKRMVAFLWQRAAMIAPLWWGGEGVQLLSLGAAPGRHLRWPLSTAALVGCIQWWRQHLMVVVMNNDEAMLRRQGQKEAATDSRRNNQIKTMVAAVAAGGDGGRICVMATIDNGSNGRQWGGGKKGQQRQLQVLRVPSNGQW